MTRVTTTPPALRWVAIFLAACAVLGLFLGFRDQIRKNPPGWYTGAEQVAVPLPSTPDTARDAVAFDPSAKTPAAPVAVSGAPEARTSPQTPAETAAPADANADPVPVPPPPPAKVIAPPVMTPAAPAKPRPTPRPAPSSDPVGDILEGQKQAETPAPAAVPY